MVVLTAKSTEKGTRAVADLKRIVPAASVEFLQLDLSSFGSIRSFVQTFLARDLELHILINNAGVFCCPHTKTAEGFEVTVGVGYIGHVLLTQLLLDKLKESAPARIVWVTASAKIKATLDWDDLGSEKVDVTGTQQAARCATLKLLAAFELDRRLKGTGVDVTACHPGIAATEAANKLDTQSGGFFPKVMSFAWPLIGQSVDKAVLPILYAATAPHVIGQGVYYGPPMFGGAVEEQQPGHAYVWKRGGEGLEPDLESWSRAFETVQRIIEGKKRLGFAPVAL
ncbi:g9465 [Coccomyxa elongata]